MQAAEYQNDPQIIVVDAMVEGIGSQGITDDFARLLRELSIFLEVIVGIHSVQQRDQRVWMYSVDANGRYTGFELRGSAYYEPELHPQMPVDGARPAIGFHVVQRPSLGNPIDLATMDQRTVPSDTQALWQQLQSLSEDLRRQFLEAGNAYGNAQSFWPDQRTAFASFLVVSCEALKPVGGTFDGANIYDVVNSLRGAAAAGALRNLALHPQGIRSQHFHRGKVVAEELAPRFGSRYFEDPSFDELLSVLQENCRVCLIEWLRRGGAYTLLWMPRQKLKWMRRVRKAIAILRGSH